MMEYGLRRTFSVNCPASSWPTYPGGEPIILDTVCFSIYSLMSKRISASLLSNNYSDINFESSFLPTHFCNKHMLKIICNYLFLSTVRLMSSDSTQLFLL